MEMEVPAHIFCTHRESSAQPPTFGGMEIGLYKVICNCLKNKHLFHIKTNQTTAKERERLKANVGLGKKHSNFFLS